MSSRARQVARVMQQAAQLDREWQGKVPQTAEDKARYTPWMPFSRPALIELLAEALAWYDPGENEDVKFLGIGCGPGSELLIARGIFGLDAHGIDRVPEYVAAACSLGLRAILADALSYTGYGRYRVIWFNRVARDVSTQLAIEHAVWSGTAPGAVVICANLEQPPPQTWFPVLEDWELRRGIWAKPATG